MEETQTWRSLLGEVIRSSLMRQRLAEELGVKPITLSRWAMSISNPRPETLRALPAAMPTLQQQLITLIEQEYPGLFANIHHGEKKEQGIPSAFYAHFFHDYSNLPINLRESSLHLIAIQQLIAQLDPQQHGIAVFIIQCTPPSSGDRISSLFKMMGRGTAQWEETFSHQAQLFGVESLPGNALQQAHYLMIPNSKEHARLYTDQHHKTAESRIAVPILLADQAAGCLCVYSNQPDHFTSTQIDLLLAYADVLTVAFAPEDFYPLQNITLGVMPAFEIQRPYLKTFQQRVLTHIREATGQQQLLTRAQAEIRVWQELEQTLLNLPFPGNL